MEPACIGVLEFSSIAAGIEAMDRMIKTAPVGIVDAKTVCPGKYYIIITGEVAAVDASLSAGKKGAEAYLIDELFIPNLHPQILPAIAGTVTVDAWDALGVIESFSVVASIVAGDLAAKEAQVIILEVRLATGMGGKSYVKFMGPTHEVEASVSVGVEYVKRSGLLCKHVIIASPHPEMKPYIL